MQRFQRGLIRIIKGPTGGFLASLGIAAILGGVALASPAPPIPTEGGHPTGVVAAAPLGGNPTGASAALPIASGGVHTDDDPSGRGSAVAPGKGGTVPGDPNTGGPSAGNGSSGGTRSAGHLAGTRKRS